MLGVLSGNQVVMCLVAVGVVGVMCYLIGHLFSKTSGLEKLLSNHLDSVNNRMETIGKEMHGVQEEVSGLRGDIRKFIEEFRK